MSSAESLLSPECPSQYFLNGEQVSGDLSSVIQYETPKESVRKELLARANILL